MTQTIKLIVIDLDGTLLNSQHKLTGPTEKALKAAIEKGIQVVLATGRTRFAAAEVIRRLNLMTPGIYLQGLAIYNADGTIRHQQTLSPVLARQVVTFAEDRGYSVVAFSGMRIMARHESSFAYDFARFHEPLPEAVGPLQNILDEVPINKLIALGEPQRIKALRWQLNMQLNGSVKLTQTHLPNMLEILPPRASKGAALKVLIREMDVAPHEVMAIGDAENDIEMLQLAGIGVAVGNADQRTKDVADYVVASNEEDGVAEAVERFVLKSDQPADSEPAGTVESGGSPAASAKSEDEAE